VDLETRTWAAWQAQDAAFFERILAEDHLDVHPTGIVSKAVVVGAVRARICRVARYALGPMNPHRIDERTWLVTYRAEQETTCAGVAVPSPAWVTSLYVRRDGHWLNVLFQPTPAR